MVLTDESTDEEEMLRDFDPEAELIMQSDTLPKKSADRYKLVYETYKKWQMEHQSSLSSSEETNLVVYFKDLSKRLKPSTLWSMWSMLKKTLYSRENLDITKFYSLKSLIKNNSIGYKPKKSLIFRWDEIFKVMNVASDHTHFVSKCPYSKISWIQQDKNTSVILSTAKSVTWRVYNDSGIEDFRSASDENGIICQFQPNLEEYGIYELTIDDEGCEFDSIVEPASNTYKPLIIIFVSILCFLIAFSITRLGIIFLRNKWHSKSSRKAAATVAGDESVGNNDGVIYSSPPAPMKKKNRVLSIDTFRGVSILTMIFVNNGAGGYAFLEHATWDGLLAGDLVFPCFVWVMGVCIPISLSSQLARGISRFTISRGILKRSIMLFLMDLSINTLGTDAELAKIRIFGVLQRFAVAYFIVGILYTFLSRRKEEIYEPNSRERILSRLRFDGFLSLLPQWIAIFIIAAVHCGITFCLPVPGCPTGYLGPGGRHVDGQYANCTGGAAGYVDRTLLGTNHLYQRPTIDHVYGSGPFEPEGILGCLTTVLQTFLGVQTGKILRVHRGWKDRVLRWLVLALVCGSIGSALHFTNTIPINKNLWSLSFVFLTTSFALALFTACYLLVDVLVIWRGGPFRIPGMNALVMYVGHRMCHQIFPFHWKYGEMMSHTWRTIAAVWDVTAWTIVAYFLHRKRIYISL